LNWIDFSFFAPVLGKEVGTVQEAPPIRKNDFSWLLFGLLKPKITKKTF
jgi:hypothetical protein